jgi:hypothetical protein
MTASGVAPRKLASQTISRSCMEVLTKPGQTQFTRIPLSATSRASACVNPTTANLLAE